MIQITLKAKYYALITQLMPNSREPIKVNYINQVRRAIVDAFDPEQEITVEVEPELIRDMYNIMGSQQERLTAADNREIKAALVPQLYAHPDLLSEILAITEANAAQTEQLRQAGIDYIMSIEP